MNPLFIIGWLSNAIFFIILCYRFRDWYTLFAFPVLLIPFWIGLVLAYRELNKIINTL